MQDACRRWARAACARTLESRGIPHPSRVSAVQSSEARVHFAGASWPNGNTWRGSAAAKVRTVAEPRRDSGVGSSESRTAARLLALETAAYLPNSPRRATNSAGRVRAYRRGHPAPAACPLRGRGRGRSRDRPGPQAGMHPVKRLARDPLAGQEGGAESSHVGGVPAEATARLCGGRVRSWPLPSRRSLGPARVSSRRRPRGRVPAVPGLLQDFVPGSKASASSSTGARPSASDRNRRVMGCSSGLYQRTPPWWQSSCREVTGQGFSGKLGAVAGDRGVQVQATVLGQLHHRHCGHRLGDGRRGGRPSRAGRAPRSRRRRSRSRPRGGPRRPRPPRETGRGCRGATSRPRPPAGWPRPSRRTGASRRDGRPRSRRLLRPARRGEKGGRQRDGGATGERPRRARPTPASPGP